MGPGLTFPLLARRRLAGLAFGQMRSSRRGPGFDLAGSRPYRPGDDVRRIDRRASARLSTARSRDEFIVREHLTEEAARVVLFVDRRPTMALFPEALPWLNKPTAIAEAGRLIVDSALQARCLVGYLDYADAEHPDPERRSQSPFWRPPNGRTPAWRLKEHYLAYPGFCAPDDCLALGLGHLASLHGALPSGSFVFLLSDFLVFPPEEVLLGAIAKRWDIVPVVIQDPVWEQSFPDVSGVVLPLADPASGRLSLVRLTRAEAQARKRESEARLAATFERFDAMGLDWVLVSAHGPDAVLGAFLAWAEGRREGAGLLR